MLTANCDILFGDSSVRFSQNPGPELTEAYIAFRNLYQKSRELDAEIAEFYKQISYSDGCLGDLQNKADNGYTVDSFGSTDTNFPTERHSGERIPAGFPIELDEHETTSKIKTETQSLLSSHFSVYDKISETKSQPCTIDELRSMDEYRLEKVVADAWAEKGWSTTVTSGSHDMGIDFIATKSVPFNLKYLFQVKRYDEDNKVGSQQIRKYSTLKQQETAVDCVVIATTSSFTKPAIKLANKINIKTMTGDDILSLLSNNSNEYK